MIPPRRKILLQTMKLFDLLSMIFVFILVASFESDVERVTFEQFFSIRISILNFLLFSGFVFIWYHILQDCDLYTSKRLSSPLRDIVDIIKFTSIGTIVLITFKMLFHIRMVNIGFLVMFCAGITMITILSRLMLKFVLEQLRLRGRNLRNIIIIGTNSRAMHFAKQVVTKNELGYRLIGFVDKDWPQLLEVQQAGYVVVSSLKEFPSYLRNNVIDEVMICLPMQSLYQEASDIIAVCEEQGIIVRILSDFFTLRMAHTKTLSYDGESTVTLLTGGMVGNHVLIKRVVDFIFALVLVIGLLPLFVVVALLIKLTSPGPIFFVQERLGLNKSRFGVFKFRTMVHDAEKKQAELEHLNEVSGPVFKIKNDPRLTCIGKFLRKTSIDELPQLINVLKGDMSLVGPRPMAVRDYDGFYQDWHRRRFSVRPGITCLWQISGRNNLCFEKWMELDMHYIDNWSMWLDLKILLRTIPAVLKGRGAM